MTVDDELTLLEDNLRRLKIEYEIYFSGGSKKPPTDIDWRVRSILKKYCDGRRMSYTQRFRYNTLANRYAIFQDLWRQKVKIKEEGYRRPQDAVLAIAGLRPESEREASVRHESTSLPPFSIRCSDLDAEPGNIKALFEAMVAAREQAGTPVTANFEAFHNFVRQKTTQICRTHACSTVEYSIEIRDAQVRLKAKAKRE